VLPLEVDARWSLVQTSWGLGLGSRLVSFEIAPDHDAVDLYVPARLRRGPITGVRDALSGYQDGRCAYCGTPFTDIGRSRVAVDHVLPFVLMSRGWPDGDLHQIWNLVLSCYGCSSAKRDRPPAADWIRIRDRTPARSPRLQRRRTRRGWRAERSGLRDRQYPRPRSVQIMSARSAMER
jgi:hypothetical protein